MVEQDTAPDAPAHAPGTNKGEEQIENQGKEPGRDEESHRTARDSSSINIEEREPIDPRMPHMPPA
jgi:hypothetical protein